MGAGRDNLPDDWVTKNVELGGIKIDFARNVMHGHIGEQRLEPKQAHLLAYLLHRTGQVATRDELIKHVWNGAAGADQSLTNTISQLRKQINNSGSEDIRIETVPKRGYRLIATQELYSGSNSQAQSNRPKQNAIPRTGIFAFLFIGFALIIAGFINSDNSDPLNSNRTSTPGFNQFALGVSTTNPESELLNKFALDFKQGAKQTFATNRLTLVRSSSGESRNVAEFSVNAEITELSGNMIVSLEMVHNPTDVIIWSSQQSRNSSEFEHFAEHLPILVSNMSRCIVNIRERFGNLNDPELLIRIGQECYVEKGGEFAYYNLAELTRDYLTLVPESSESHARHGTALAMNVFLWPFIPEDEMKSIRADAYEHLRKALEIDPNNSMAYLGLSYLPDPNVSSLKRIEYSKFVLKNDPDIMMSRIQIGYQLLSLGRVDDAMGYFDRVVEDFPLEQQFVLSWWRQVMASSPARVGVAHNAMKPYVERFPDSALLVDQWFEAEFWYGNPDFARELAAMNGYTEPYTICMELILKARELQTRPDLNELRDLCIPGAWTAEYLYFAYFGYVDDAIEILKSKKDILSEPSVIFIRRHMFQTFMAPVHNDPRFFEFAREIGLVDFWLETGLWPDFCSRKDLSYDCKELAKSN